MRLYLDASVIVPLLFQDVLASRAEGLMRAAGSPELLLSDFAAAEFASAVGRKVRTGEVDLRDARLSFSTLDVWESRFARRIETTSADLRVAETFLRRLDLTLRTPDALHIALAQRMGATLATFDAKMAAAARALGTDVLAA